MTLSDALAPFVVGAPRSGTTLLRMMLDAHPQMAIPPETNFAVLFEEGLAPPETVEEFCNKLISLPNWVDFKVDEQQLLRTLRAKAKFDIGEGLRSFYCLYAGRFGKTRWGDKTPGHGLSMDLIARALPEARFVHIIRDGRDVAVSLRDMWFSPSRDYGELGKFWAARVQGITSAGVGRPDYMEVRYEALLIDTANVLRQICSFIELDFDDAMLRYYERSGARLLEHEGRFNPDGSIMLTKAQRLAQQKLVKFPPDSTRIGDWRNVMNKDDIEKFENEAGQYLINLGYT